MPTTTAQGQPAPWAHHSNGSAEPQLAAATDISSGGGGAPAVAVGKRNAMHKLNVSLDPRVHNRAHFSCGPHSIANWERELLGAEAEERRQASELLLLVGEAALAFAVGYLALHVFALLS